MNNVKTFLLMGALMALFLAAGQAIGGSQGLVTAFVMGSLMNFGMFFFSDKLVLRMYGARLITEAEAPELYRMVDRLRQRAGLPMPKLAVAPHEQPNAFATGRSPRHAVVAVTTGILKFMPPEELEAVLAHELAHIKNRDMLISTIAAGFAGAIGYLPYLLLFTGQRDNEGRHPFVELALVLLGPIAAMVIQFAVSRQREFEADRVGAELLGRPMRTGTHFLILALMVGMVQGGTQALSRSLFASLIPRQQSAEFFGFFAVVEKFAGIFGPALFAQVIALTGSSRGAILSVIAFFVVGGVLLHFVDVEQGQQAAREAEAAMSA